MRVIIEIDSCQVVNMFNEYPNPIHITRCWKKFCNASTHTREFGAVRSVLHTPRSSNGCDDVVTKLGYSLDPNSGTLFLDDAPSNVLDVVVREAVL